MEKPTYMGGRTRRSVRRRLGQWRRHLEPQVLVLMYHRVANVPCDPWDQCVSPEHFDEQMDVLKRSFDIVPLSDIAELAGGRFRRTRAAAITFDDGYADNLYAAAHILDGHSLPATFFLTSGLIGAEREFWWDELERIFLLPGSLPNVLTLPLPDGTRTFLLGDDAEMGEHEWERQRAWRAWNAPETTRQRVYHDLWSALRPLPPEAQGEGVSRLIDWAHVSRAPRATHRIMNADEVRHLASNSRFEIGAHSIHHSALSEQPLDAQVEEIGTSKAALEELVARPVLHFAYPYGDYSVDTAAAVRQAGYAAAFSTREGAVRRGGSRFSRPRCKVFNWSGEDFARRLKIISESA